MKNLFCTFCIFLMASAVAFAQEPSPISSGRRFRDVQDSLFQYLDKTRLTTGVLYDRAFHWEDATQDGNIDTLEMWKALQYYHELYISTYDPSAIKSLEALWEMANLSKFDHNAIPIGFINYAFEEIDTNALTDGRLAYRNADSLLEDGAGGSPYITHRLITPIVFAERFTDSVVSFYFDPELSLIDGNSGVIDSLILSNNLGEQILLTPGSQGSLTVLSSELQEGVHIDISIFSRTYGPRTGGVGGGNTPYGPPPGYYGIESGKGNCVTAPATPIYSGPGLKFKGYDESYPTEAQGETRTYYHLNTPNCDPHIRKPIIILDGFDPENAERYRPDDIYDLLGYDPVYQSQYRRDFMRKHLGLELRQKGYDVIVLNFPQYKYPTNLPWPFPQYRMRDGGADFMERNAMVLIKLIQNVNAELLANGSNEKVVVMGPSMGGQISRYALKYMEDHQMDHNCRMWVAFDSPNLGANIPLSVQTSIWYLGYIADEAKARMKYRNSMRSVAAKQLLVYQIGGPVTGDTLKLGFYEPFREYWQSMIDNWGYPNKDIRRIAICNGAAISGSGPSCSDIFHYTIKKNSPPHKGKTIFELRPKTIPMYSTSSCMLFDGAVDGDHKNYSTPLTNLINKPIPDFHGDLDGAPGGLFKSALFLKKELKIGDINFRRQWRDAIDVNGTGKLETNGEDSHCFIPTVSGLGIYNHNYSWRTLLDANSLMCNNQTPFHNFYIAPSNEQHVTVTQGNVDFLMSELDFSGTITGPDYPRACQKSLYTLNAPLPAGSSLSWSTAAPFQLQPLSPGLVFVKPNYAGATGTFKATITYANCVKRDISFTTKGTTDAIYSLGFTGLPNCNWQAFVTPAVSADSYRWSLDIGTHYYNNSPTFYPPGTSGYIPGSSNQVLLRISPGVCQSSSNPYVYLSKTFNRTTSGCDPDPGDPPIAPPFRKAAPGASEIVEVSPNPTNSDWRLIIGNPDAKNIEATLKDAAGRTLWNRQTTEGAFGIPVVPGEGLSAGIYFLYLRIEGKAYQFKLMKQ